MAKTLFGTLKLAPLTNSKALAADGTGTIVEAATTAAELDFLSGVTSAVQTQIDGKQADDADLTALAGLSTTGIIARTGAGTAATRTLTQSTGITIADADGVAGNPTFSTNDAAINHDALLNFVANEHVDHTAVLMTTAAESGLTGGGDISATRTLSVDITGTTAVGTLASTDEVLIWDTSAAALKKTTVSAIADSATPSFVDTWTTAQTATKAITHNLGSTDLIVQIYDITNGENVLIDTIDRTDANTLTVTASEAPPAGSWKVLILAI